MSSGQLCRFGAFRPPRYEMGSAQKIARLKNASKNNGTKNKAARISPNGLALQLC